MDKAPDAFRTISEVAEDLDVPQHVLRFWETRFGQIKPLKRGGGRRYYRPDDVDLLRGIRHLLYGEGYTIRGVQRILKDNGLKFVQSVWVSGAPQPETPAPEEAATSNGFEHGGPAPEDLAAEHRSAGPLPGHQLTGAHLTGHRENGEPREAPEVRIGSALHEPDLGPASEDSTDVHRSDHEIAFERRPAELEEVEYATVEDGVIDDEALEDSPAEYAERDAPSSAHAGGALPRLARASDATPSQPIEQGTGSPGLDDSGHPVRAGPASPSGLSPADRRRLQDALLELDACRHILDAALKDEDEV